MGTNRTFGNTKSAATIADDLVKELADKAEAGFDVNEIIRRPGGRPAMGSAAAPVESVRLEPELGRDQRAHAEVEGRANSDALRRYLRAAKGGRRR